MYVRVRVTPGAKRERVERCGAEAYEVAVREPAARNLANTRARELVARELGVPTDAVRLISGHRSRTKVMSVTT